MGYRVALVSLGCAKNLVDSEVMMGYLREAGHELVYDPEQAEVVVVNTCGFIDSAKQESIDQLLDCAELKKTHELRWLIAAGCLSQRYSADLAESMPEVDAFIGNSDYPAIVETIERLDRGEKGGEDGSALRVVDRPEKYLQVAAMPRQQATLPATAYLKVSDGCDNRCSYCAIPLIRGGHRSRSLEDVLSEARRLLAAGVKEICLIAQDTTRYGLDNYGRLMLADLCRELLRMPELKWLRLLYSHPSHLTTEVMELMSRHPQFCAYLDLPLQHSETRLLRQMNRPNSREEIVHLLAEARRLVPDVMLRTTFIVGFPGETEQEFQALLQFMQELRFDHVGAFAYSQEEDTLAAEMPQQIEEAVKEDRLRRLMELQQGIAAERMRRWLGREVEVLIERILDNGQRIGRFQGQAPDVDGLILLSGSDAAVGEIALARLTAVRGYDLLADAL